MNSGSSESDNALLTRYRSESFQSLPCGLLLSSSRESGYLSKMDRTLTRNVQRSLQGVVYINQQYHMNK